MTNPGFQNGISRAVLPLTDLSTVTNGGNFKTVPVFGYSKGPILNAGNLPPPFQPVGNPIFSFSLLGVSTSQSHADMRHTRDHVPMQCLCCQCPAVPFAVWPLWM